MNFATSKLSIDKNLYKRIHDWARKNVPKPNRCAGKEHQGDNSKPLEISNNSRLYKFEIDDWEWICHKCHGAKDHWGKGIPKSADHRRKIGQANAIALLGNIPWNKGKFGYKMPPSSEEKKRKLRIASKGQIPWNKGKKVGSYPKERMEKLWAARRGKPSWNKGLKFV